jgi:hypothetical protein
VAADERQVLRSADWPRAPPSVRDGLAHINLFGEDPEPEADVDHGDEDQPVREEGDREAGELERAAGSTDDELEREPRADELVPVAVEEQRGEGARAMAWRQSLSNRPLRR